MTREVVREWASELRDRGHLGASRHEQVPELAHLALVIINRWCTNGSGRALVVLVRVHQTARRMAERAPAGVPGAAVLHVVHAALERHELGFPLLAQRKGHRWTALVLMLVEIMLLLVLGLRFMMVAGTRGGGRRNRGRRWHWDLERESELSTATDAQQQTDRQCAIPTELRAIEKARWWVLAFENAYYISAFACSCSSSFFQHLLAANIFAEKENRCASLTPKENTCPVTIYIPLGMIMDISSNIQIQILRMPVYLYTFQMSCNHIDRFQKVLKSCLSASLCALLLSPY